MRHAQRRRSQIQIIQWKHLMCAQWSWSLHRCRLTILFSLVIATNPVLHGERNSRWCHNTSNELPSRNRLWWFHMDVSASIVWRDILRHTVDSAKHIICSRRARKVKILFDVSRIVLSQIPGVQKKTDILNKSGNLRKLCFVCKPGNFPVSHPGESGGADLLWEYRFTFSIDLKQAGTTAETELPLKDFSRTMWWESDQRRTWPHHHHHFGY